MIEWFSEEIEAGRPSERISISDHSEKYRVLGPPSAETGPLKLSRTPYLIPMLNIIQDPRVEEVYLCKPAQIAGTEFAVCVVDYFAHIEPCPIFYVMADEKTSIDISKDRIQQSFLLSPEMSKLIDEAQFNNDNIRLRNTAQIIMAWASSVSRLGSRPARIVILDEIDKPGYMRVTNEANPIKLAKNRTVTYYDSKVIGFSSPTIDEGNIWVFLNSCDVIYDWHAKCPDCGTYQPLRWNNKDNADFKEGAYLGHDGKEYKLGMVTWDGGREATPEQIDAAGYACGTCGVIWDTAKKNIAVENGMMVSRKPVENLPKKVGFHINRLYSLLADSGDIPKLVGDWIECHKEGQSSVQDFINSTLAEPWKIIISKSSEDEILKAKNEDVFPNTVPRAVIALTCGVDVQKGHLMYTVWGWCSDYTSYLVDYGELDDFDHDLNHLLFERTYPYHGKGASGQLSIWRCGIDLKGPQRMKMYSNDISTTDETYMWISANKWRGVELYPMMGSSQRMSVKCRAGYRVEKTPSGQPLPQGMQLILIDGHMCKNSLRERLKHAAEGNEFQPAYLHNETGKDFAHQILGEELRFDKKKKTQVWVEVHANHYLDCSVMAHALTDITFPKGGLNILGGMTTNQPQMQAQSKGSGNRGRRESSRSFEIGRILRR